MLPPPEKYQPTNTLAKHVFVSFLTPLSCIVHHKILVYKTHTQYSKHYYRECLRHPQPIHMRSWQSEHFRQWSDSSGDLPNILGKVGRAAMGFGTASNMLPPPEKCQPTNTLAKHGFVSFLTLLSCIVHHKILVYKTHTVLETLLYLVFKTSSGDIHASIFRIAMAVSMCLCVLYICASSVFLCRYIQCQRKAASETRIQIKSQDLCFDHEL